MKAPKLNLPGVKKQDDYEVGYGKPPADTRFKPGRSGNPKGRPRGAKNKRPALNEERLKDIILEEAYRSITVRDGLRNVSVPMAQAVVRSLAINAAKGQHRAQRLFAEMLSSTERQNKALSDEWLNTAIEYKVEWERELHRRQTHGITNLPPPLPHPDHLPRPEARQKTRAHRNAAGGQETGRSGSAAHRRPAGQAGLEGGIEGCFQRNRCRDDHVLEPASINGAARNSR